MDLLRTYLTDTVDSLELFDFHSIKVKQAVVTSSLKLISNSLSQWTPLRSTFFTLK